MSTVFFHIPKTAGTTLMELILKNNRAEDYFHFRGNELPGLSELQKTADRHQFLFGHFRFREELVDEHFLLTFLREPVNRCVSQFFHFRKTDRLIDAPLLEQMEHFLSEDEVVKNGIFNLQTQWLAGEVRQRDVFAQPEKHLKLAGENLQKLNFVGIAENFTESAFMLCQQLGWKKWYFVPHNVHDNHAEKKLILDNFGTELQRINELDSELYRQALELFEKQKKSIHVPKIKRFKAISLSRLKKLMS